MSVNKGQSVQATVGCVAVNGTPRDTPADSIFAWSSTDDTKCKPRVATDEKPWIDGVDIGSVTINVKVTFPSGKSVDGSASLDCVVLPGPGDDIVAATVTFGPSQVVPASSLSRQTY